MEDITAADYVYAIRKRYWKNAAEYHDFYVQSNLAEVFENFRYMCLEIYELIQP